MPPALALNTSSTRLSLTAFANFQKLALYCLSLLTRKYSKSLLSPTSHFRYLGNNYPWPEGEIPVEARKSTSATRQHLYWLTIADLVCRQFTSCFTVSHSPHTHVNMSDSDSEYDADLKRAIALSLRDQSQPKSSPASKPIPEVIDLLSSSDEEIEDFDAPPVRKRKVLPPSASKAAAKSPAKPDIKSEEPDIEIMKEVRSSKPISQTSRGVQKSNLPASANLSGNSNNSTTSSVADATQSSTETLEDDQPAKDFVAENSTTPDPVVSPLFHPKSDEAPHTSLVDGRFPSPCSEVPHALKPALNSSSTITDVNQPQKLDRKKMEEERLMRLKQRKLKEEGLGGLDANDSRKRKSSQSPIQSPSSAARQSKKVMTLDRSPGEGIRPGDNVTPSSGQYLDHPCSKPQDQGASAIQYPNGVVKKTWVYGQPRDNDVKIEEVLQKDTLQLAVLSAFQVEPEWVVRKLGPATRVVWVLQVSP